MKPRFESSTLKKWYVAALAVFVALIILYILALLVITCLSATDGGIMASPFWGLLALVGTVPVILPLIATFLTLRRILIIQTNAFSPDRRRFELIFTVAPCALCWLTALLAVIWLSGKGTACMYLAIAAMLLALSLLSLRYFLRKSRYGGE